jgi:hypothetical protein
MAFKMFARSATIRHRTSIALIIPLSSMPVRCLYPLSLCHGLRKRHWFALLKIQFDHTSIKQLSVER